MKMINGEHNKVYVDKYGRLTFENETTGEKFVPTEALKFDIEKAPLDLLPFHALTEVAKVLEHGKKKYTAHNWRKGMDWSRLSAASLRHLFAWNNGENDDPESELSHLAHAACCILFLLEYSVLKLGNDDRYTTETAPTFEDLIEEE